MTKSTLESIFIMKSIQEKNEEFGCNRYIISNCESATQVMETYALFGCRLCLTTKIAPGFCLGLEAQRPFCGLLASRLSWLAFGVDRKIQLGFSKCSGLDLCFGAGIKLCSFGAPPFCL